MIRRFQWAISDGLGDMLPLFAANNAIDCTLRNPVVFTQCALCHSVRGVFADLAHCLSIESRSPLPFASYNAFWFALCPVLLATRRICAAFAEHVMQVVSICAYPQMSRIHAASHVAAMANEHANRNRAMCQFPRSDMGTYAPPVIPNLPISGRLDMRSPEPASISAARPIHLLPQTITERARCAGNATRRGAIRSLAILGLKRDAAMGANEGILRTHSEPPTLSAMPGAVAAAPRLRRANYSMGTR